MGLLQKGFSAAKKGQETYKAAKAAKKTKKAAKAAEKAGGKALVEEAKQAKLARKGQKKIDRKKYGGGKKGKANKAADIARKAAASKMEEVGMGDSMDDTSMDGASMKKYGASAKKLKREVKKTKASGGSVKNVFKKGDKFASKQTKKTKQKGPNSAEEARLGVVKKKTKQTAKMSGKTGANEGGKYKSKTKFVKDGVKAKSKIKEKVKDGVKSRKEVVKSGGEKLKLKSMPMDLLKEGPAKNPKKYGSSMSGENYDAKQAYNKNLSASARLHYLENNRADKKAKGGSHRSPIMKHMKNI